MKELVIKKDSDRVEFESFKNMGDYLCNFNGVVLYQRVCKDYLPNIIVYHGKKKMNAITFYEDGFGVKEYFDKEKSSLSSGTIKDYKIFTCNTFDEAYQKMKEMEGER